MREAVPRRIDLGTGCREDKKGGLDTMLRSINQSINQWRFVPCQERRKWLFRFIKSIFSSNKYEGGARYLVSSPLENNNILSIMEGCSLLKVVPQFKSIWKEVKYKTCPSEGGIIYEN